MVITINNSNQEIIRIVIGLILVEVIHNNSILTDTITIIINIF
jgi:hypothetical protein